jgi:class 3 adenylate cyclase/predicted ATPase
MTFDEVLLQIQELLQREKRVSYRGLKRRFALDDEYLEDLKEELIGAKRLAADEDGRFLVWRGGAVKEETGKRRNGETEKIGLEFSVQGLESGGQGRTSPDSGLRDSGREAAERRQLTVMFCDLVGSTALSAQLDPEDLREVVRAYQQTSAAVIARYDGYIAQYLGDGLLVYFGYPTAHEDDAARAVRAGLEIAGAIHELPLLQQPLQVRIGIHTGPVVVGEMGGEGRQEQLALGETPNIAARIQGKAEPDTVVISAATQRPVAGLFECEDCGLHDLKGISTPVPLYRVTAESVVHSRFEATLRSGLTPLVGREEELQFLQQRWEQARAGEGRAVLVSGEPGIGKSRLVEELKQQVTREGATRIEFQCSPYHQHSALYPVITHLQRLLRFERDDSAATKLEKLQQALTSYRFPQADTVSLLAALLSLPQPDGVPPLTLSPQKQKERTLETLVRWVCEEAERTAVVCTWEDLHWADPSSLELLTLCLDQTPTVRMLVLLICRPEFTPPWGTRSYLSQLTLGRLDRRQVDSIVARVTGGKAFPVAVVEQIAAKTDGVPLFVEELTKSVIESIGSIGSLESIGSVESIGSEGRLGRLAIPLGIPATLQDALMARLDRLGPGKQVVQLGATLGREFSYEVLQAVSPLDEAALQQGLWQLVEAELLYQRSLPPQATYLFKHALIQDTAYQSLLKSTRQQYHRQIAQTLEERFPDTKETQPELLAHHYTQAGLITQAIPYWQQAGQRAVERSAYVEAMNHLTRGLELLTTLPDTANRAQQELMLQFTLCGALAVTKGYASHEVEKAHARALELCRRVGETPQLLRVLLGLSAFHMIRGTIQTVRELAEQCLSLAQRMQDPVALLWAHCILGEDLLWLGELASAREHVEQGLALYDPRKPSFRTFRGVHDPGVSCLSVLSWALWFLGYPEQALQKSHDMLTLAQELAHPFSVALALSFTTSLHLFRREEQATQERAEELIALATEQGFPFRAPVGIIRRGWALAERGQGEEGIEQLRQGLAAFRATGAGIAQPSFLASLADAYGKAGRIEEGLTILSEALAVVDQHGERLYEAELYRLKGELTLQSQTSSSKSQTSRRQVKNKPKVTNPQSLTSNPQEEAQACFLKAIDIARSQSAKSLELRATTSLARLWQQQGKKKEARQMLAEIYGWFTEGFDTVDLKEAKMLLMELM